MTPARRGLLCAAAGALLLSMLSACGGGGGGGGGGNQPPALAIVNAPLGDGVIGAAYNWPIDATGATGAVTFSISAGSLPAGLSINAATGAVSGTPAGPVGTSNFTVRVVDSGMPQQSATRAFAINIFTQLQFTTAALPSTTIGAAYNQSITAQGGLPPYAFNVANGSLPAGLTLNTATGVISGVVATTAANGTFTIRVLDAAGPTQTATHPFRITVALEVLTTSLPNAEPGLPYSQMLQAGGGQPPYGWMETAGSLPPNFGLNGDGRIIGAPAGNCFPATATFDVQVRDTEFPAQTATRNGLSITVAPRQLTFLTPSLPEGIVGTPYIASVQISGGTPPITFSTNGMLPNQLGPIDSATGQIDGTPDTAETHTFIVNVIDACGVSASRPYTIAINAAAAGRNDSIATATPLTNGSFQASISPSGHPNTVFDVDEDFYRLTTSAASMVVISIDAQDLGSPLDSVIEIVNGNGVRLNNCTSPDFNSPCVNDDEVLGQQLDSFLVIQVGGPTTFYVRVVDWRGDARPDLKYTIHVSGVN